MVVVNCVYVVVVRCCPLFVICRLSFVDCCLLFVVRSFVSICLFVGCWFWVLGCCLLLVVCCSLLLVVGC